MKRIAERARAEAKNVYTHRGARLTPQVASQRTHLWAPMAKHDRTFYQINREHPLVRQVMETTSDRAALAALLSLLQETIPLQHITISSTEKPDCQPQPFEGADETQIMEVMLTLFRSFRASGCTAEEARTRLRSHWPFELFPALLATLDESTP